MADPRFKLFRAVDPSQVKVPIDDRFAKLTLSSNKKKKQQQQKKENTKKDPEMVQLLTPNHRQLEIGADDTQVDFDGSDYMDPLHFSGDGMGCTQTQDKNGAVDVLSEKVSNLTIEPPEQVSICISSTTEEQNGTMEEDDEASCITISDSSDDEVEEEIMAVSEQEPAQGPEQGPPMLTSDKVERIEAFLRDVSMERREMAQHGHAMDNSSPLSSGNKHSRLANAETESMSLSQNEEVHWPNHGSPVHPCNDTVMDTLCSQDLRDLNKSKRLADNDTEINTICSDEENQDSSRRFAGNDTEVNTLCSDVDNEDVNSVTIPETSSSEDEDEIPKHEIDQQEEQHEPDYTAQPLIQISSINISAKINIKIHIPSMGSSSSSDEQDESKQNNELEAEENKRPSLSPTDTEVYKENHGKSSPNPQSSFLVDDASEDEQFLNQAEKLLNELYGKAWQTPDIIRTLKRSSNSGGKETPKPQPRHRRPQPVTECKKQTKAKKNPPTGRQDESFLGDFSIFKRALRTNSNQMTPLNSTHLPINKRAAQTDKPRSRPRTKHLDETRWRALIDSDTSGTDASDDEDADATQNDCSSSPSSSSSSSKSGHVTYLDLSQREVQVVGTNHEDLPVPQRLDDVLRSCRPSIKAKIPATPNSPAETKAAAPPIRRQLFTPNVGYEDDVQADKIVERALELDMLDDLEEDHLPGTPVHKRIQQIKKQMARDNITPKAAPKSTTKLTPKATPKTLTKEAGNPMFKPPPASSRKKKTDTDHVQGKYSFLKSLEGRIPRHQCNNEAFFYRENFAKNKQALAHHLYKLFNAGIFNNELDVPITWSKLLRNTAGRCKNKKKMNQRSSTIELSEKVLTSADRLRCTLIHELCHAAAWVFNGEGGHGRVWKMWARRSTDKFPELPAIQVCHSYAIEFKYTYKCQNCDAASHAHSRSRKVEHLRCRLCHGPITLLINKKDKSGNIVSTPAGEAKGFAKFVKENFQKFKRPHLTAVEVMRLLGAEYAKQKKGPQDNGDKENDITQQVQILTIDDDSD